MRRPRRPQRSFHERGRRAPHRPRLGAYLNSLQTEADQILVEAAAVTAVLEALGKRRGPDDMRSAGQRYHDALPEGCELMCAS